MSKVCVVRSWRAVLNVHERRLPAPAARVGELLDSLSRPDDRLWPRERWGPMALDRGLAKGSSGGHSAIRYRVAEHVPGRRLELEFQPMAALPVFRGRHVFEVLERQGETVLRHTIDVDTDLGTWLRWKALIEPLHDALLEDALDKAARALQPSAAPRRPRWPLRVRLLRWLRARSARRGAARR